MELSFLNELSYFKKKDIHIEIREELYDQKGHQSIPSILMFAR